MSTFKFLAPTEIWTEHVSEAWAAKSRWALQPISLTPAPRSVPAPRPPASRSAPLHRFSAMPDYCSAPLHPIFGSLRAALRSHNKVHIQIRTKVGQINHSLSLVLDILNVIVGAERGE